jgi:hypothetical protein
MKDTLRHEMLKDNTLSHRHRLLRLEHTPDFSSRHRGEVVRSPIRSECPFAWGSTPPRLVPQTRQAGQTFMPNRVRGIRAQADALGRRQPKASNAWLNRAA